MRFKLTLAPYLICFLFCSFALPSCKNTLEEERTNTEDRSIEMFLSKNNWLYNNVDGVYYVIHKPSYNYQVSKGDTIEFMYIGYTLDGKVFDTNDRDAAIKAKLDILNRSFEPVVTIAGKGNLVEGLDKGMLYLHQGEQAAVLFSSSLGFGGNALGPVKQWSPLFYEVLLIKVNDVEIQNEQSYIRSLDLLSDGFSVDTSGLYYKYIISGHDSTPTINDTIYGWYRGTLADGTVIEDLDDGNKQIILSSSDIPDGVKLGFMLTKNGGTTDLVIPSYLGYGNLGKSPVKPYQTLFYQIRIDSIK